MGMNSDIEWTDATWNPVTGCTKISPGCEHCYAERMARRLKAMGQRNYANGFLVTTHVDALQIPLKWRRPKTIFVNSMGDLFHESVPEDFIRDVFAVMNRAYWHRFQILTKRSERLRELAESLPWPQNVWVGVSVELSDYSFRIEDLRHVPAAIRFLSLEPLLGPIPALNLDSIDWVIVGGESGPGARTLKPEWVRNIRNQCLATAVPFFFKQWGGVRKKAAGKVLDGQIHEALPDYSPAPRQCRGCDHSGATSVANFSSSAP